MTTRKLELIRWGSFAICVLIILAELWNPTLRKGGLGLLLFFTVLVVGFPAAMISLHLHGAEWFGSRKDAEK